MGARSAVPMAIGFWCGIVWAASLPPGPTLLLALALAGLTWLCRVQGRALAWGLLLVSALLGAARGGTERLRAAGEARAWEGGARVLRCVAIVVEPPRRAADEPVAVVEPCASSQVLPRGVRVRLRLPEHCVAEWGDTLEVLARVSPLPGMRDPGGFDAAAAARASRVSASGRALRVRVRAARGAHAMLPRLAMRARRDFEEALAHGLSPAARELAGPLLSGDRGAMGIDTDSALRASGLVHLLALSGLHVTWLAGVARALAALLGVGLRGRAFAGAGAALGYALFAGPLPSLVRAVGAEWLLALAQWSGRALDPLQSLALVIGVSLAWRPEWAGDLGFQLSCVATAGLVALGGPMSAFAERAPRVLRAPLAALAVTLGAQVAAAPLLLARFHALPWVALAANLPAVPLAELLLVAAGVGAFMECVVAGAGAPWFAAAEPLAWALHALTRFGGAWPGALPATGHHAWAPWGVALGALLLALGLASVRVRMAWLGGALVAVTIALALLAPPLRPPPGRWWLVALDVGQGDALAIGTRDGWWLVDAGPRSPRWDAGEGVVLPFLRWVGVKRLEALVLTHDDGDHTGGARALCRGLPVRGVWAPGPRPGVAGPLAHLRGRPLARGDTLAWTPHARVLWPPRADDPEVASSCRGDNAASLVLEVGEGSGVALLTADADSVVELALAPRARPALLKAGHHGSGSSSGARFLVRLGARVAVVSCGSGNPYGHPAPGTLARLAVAGTRVERTDAEGALWYELDAHGARRLDWRRRAP